MPFDCLDFEIIVSKNVSEHVGMKRFREGEENASRKKICWILLNHSPKLNLTWSNKTSNKTLSKCVLEASYELKIDRFIAYGVSMASWKVGWEIKLGFRKKNSSVHHRRRILIGVKICLTKRLTCAKVNIGNSAINWSSSMNFPRHRVRRNKKNSFQFCCWFETFFYFTR